MYYRTYGVQSLTFLSRGKHASLVDVLIVTVSPTTVLGLVYRVGMRSSEAGISTRSRHRCLLCRLYPPYRPKTVIPPLLSLVAAEEAKLWTPTTIKAVRADVEDDAPNDLVRHLRQSKYFKKKAIEVQIECSVFQDPLDTHICVMLWRKKDRCVCFFFLSIC
jgi:hypothetical protein